MGGLIDRQAAIDRIRGTGYADQIKENVIMILMGLPSAQFEKRTEERTETHACDSISRQVAIDTLKQQAEIMKEWHSRYAEERRGILSAVNIVKDLPSAQPEITDEQAIEHLQKSGWMQNHDKQMYEMGLRERLADDSGSYDALLPSAQPDLGKYEYHYDHTDCIWYRPEARNRCPGNLCTVP